LPYGIGSIFYRFYFGVLSFFGHEYQSKEEELGICNDLDPSDDL
jgi:hypothetical protein